MNPHFESVSRPMRDCSDGIVSSLEGRKMLNTVAESRPVASPASSANASIVTKSGRRYARQGLCPYNMFVARLLMWASRNSGR